MKKKISIILLLLLCFSFTACGKSEVKEIKSGYKRSHWMWYIFPQISGLGHSPIAKKYEIEEFSLVLDKFFDGNRDNKTIELVKGK